MNILIGGPLGKTEAGGPAQYAHNLSCALVDKGHAVSLITFDEVRKYPSGIRHVVLFVKALFRLSTIDAIIVLDTVSIALPMVCAASILRKKVLIRTGGDFLWEQYIERTGVKIVLSKFYTAKPNLSLKEKIVFWLQKRIIFPRATLIFSTAWQRDLWRIPYGLTESNTFVVENAYAPLGGKDVASSEISSKKIVTWIGREIALKNVDSLTHAMDEVKRTYPEVQFEKHSTLAHDEVIRKLRESTILVIPSLSEVSPNLALEALSVGTPVILTKECGLYALLKEHVTWVDPCDEKEIIRTLMQLLTDTGYTYAKEQAASFKNNRSYDDVASEILSILNDRLE